MSAETNQTRERAAVEDPVEIDVCLYDRLGGYAALLRRFCGMKKDSFARIESSISSAPEFDEFQFYSRSPESFVFRGHATMRSGQAELPLFQEVLRCGTLSGISAGRVIDNGVMDSLFGLSSLRDFVIDQGETERIEIVEQLRQAESECGCPEMTRCPFTEFKRTLINKAFVDELGAERLARSYFHQKFQKKQIVEVDRRRKEGDDKRDLAAFEVVCRGSRLRLGIACVALHNLLLHVVGQQGVKFMENQPYGLSVSMVSSEDCLNSEMAFDKFYGHLCSLKDLDGGKGKNGPRDWLRTWGNGWRNEIVVRDSMFKLACPFKTVVISPSNGEDRWLRYALDLQRVVESMYAVKMVLCRLDSGGVAGSSLLLIEAPADSGLVHVPAGTTVALEAGYRRELAGALRDLMNEEPVLSADNLTVDALEHLDSDLPVSLLRGASVGIEGQSGGVPEMIDHDFDDKRSNQARGPQA